MRPASEARSGSSAKLPPLRPPDPDSFSSMSLVPLPCWRPSRSWSHAAAGSPCCRHPAGDRGPGRNAAAGPLQNCRLIADHLCGRLRRRAPDRWRSCLPRPCRPRWRFRAVCLRSLKRSRGSKNLVCCLASDFPFLRQPICRPPIPFKRTIVPHTETQIFFSHIIQMILTELPPRQARHGRACG